jgi:hypothetical protein
MQSYPLKLLAGASTTVQTEADLFVYESGTVTGSTETRIIVKPDNGSEIVLRPGQRFRASDRAMAWNVRGYDAAAVIAGMVIIGSGEFDDANTLNRVTLDASFANVVTVANTTAQRVPVAMDETKTLNMAEIVIYGKNFTSTGDTNTFLKMIDPAENVNGLIINQLLMGVAGTTLMLTAVAKETIPASVYDGEVVDVMYITPNAPYKSGNQVKIAPGKGLWITGPGVSTVGMLKSVLYTLL